MWKSAKAQIYILFSKKSTWVVWFLMFGMMIVHFTGNIRTYYGYDASYMYNPLRLIYLSGMNYNSISLIFMQFYPLVIVLPAAFSYFYDKKSRMMVFMQARANKKEYYTGRNLSTFIVTFIIYTLPLYIEMFLNVLAFPVSLTTVFETDNIQVVYKQHTEDIIHYMFHDLWIANHVLYMIFVIALFGALTGLLAVFAQCMSMLLKFKYAVFIFLPAYILLYAADKIASDVFSVKWSAYYFDYISLADRTKGNGRVYIIFLLALAAADILVTVHMIRKDEII